MERFRLNATNLFLTYPQCAVEPKEALDLLTEILSSKGRTISEYIIAREKHADGSDHLHAYLKLDKKIDVRSASLFDLRNHHGNYQSARSATKVKKYCTKDGNYIADPPYIPPTEKDPIWRKAIETAKEGNVEEAMKILENGGERSCRDLILHRAAILSSLTMMTPVKELSCARPLTDFGNLFNWNRHEKTLVLFGETNKGKTSLAASLIPKALFTRHLDLLADLTSQHEGIILDDMAFKHQHDEAQIALVDLAMDTTVHVRYRVARIPARMPRIITTNKEPWEILNLSNPAIARRVITIRWLGWDSDPNWQEESGL